MNRQRLGGAVATVGRVGGSSLGNVRSLSRRGLAACIQVLVVLLSLSVWAPTVRAEANDQAVEAAIERAIERYAADKDVAAADQALLEAIALCQNACKRELVARAWMYIGLVVGAGSRDWDAAREAFSVALGFDPDVQLDPRFFTPTGQALFDGIKRQLQSQGEEGAADVEASFEAGTQMGCVPLVSEVQTRRPIPISCSTSVQGVDHVVLRFRAYGADRWTRVELEQKSGEWRGEVPCSALDRPGTWGMYIEAKDDQDRPVERIGSRDKPLVFKVVEETDALPPAIPGEQPPERCGQTAYCPDDMVGTPACDALMGKSTSAAGATSCSSRDDCDLGMDCLDGLCRAPDVCTEDVDCGEGSVCQAGLCALEEVPPVLDWFGIHFGADFTFLGESSNVCAPLQEGYTCYQGSGRYGVVGEITGSSGEPYGTEGGTVSSGVHQGTMRVMASYERFVMTELSVGARFGFAFGGAPEDFFPMHFEGRGTYYLGDVTTGSSTFVPYLSIGAGLAQVDSRVEVEMVDCSLGSQERCQQFPGVSEGLLGGDNPAASLRTLDAYKSFGTFFGSISPGVSIAITRKVSAVVNLGVLLMTERDSADALIFSFQPSLGISAGL